jgi:hypothetical protein
MPRTATLLLTTLAAALATTTALASPDQSQRTQAARDTAERSAACVAAQPFYWEIGDARGTLASGSSGGKRRDVVTAQTEMMIASASKWVYSSYVVQKRGGAANLSDDDVRHLNFSSGYTHFKSLGCGRFSTVGRCDPDQGKQPDPATAGQFDYNGGHMQHHADVVMGLSALNAEAFTNELLGQLGSDVVLRFRSPQPAGGGYGTAASYAVLLRKIVGGQLLMREALGTHPVCANPKTCRAPDNTAVHSPVPSNLTWHYSMGHWVEDDPQTGDGAFSSPGAFGFYPWVSADKTTYGIVAREEFKGLMSRSDELQRPAFKSVDCGRLIRKAWFSGQAVMD